MILDITHDLHECNSPATEKSTYLVKFYKLNENKEKILWSSIRIH